MVLFIFFCCCTRLGAQETAVSMDSLSVYFDKARQFRSETRFDEALLVLDKAQALAEKNEDEKALVDALHMFSLLYYDLDKKETASLYWERASVLLKNLAYPHGEAVHKYLEGLFLFDAGNNFQAVFMLNNAKKLSNDRNLLNNILLLEAKIFISIEKYPSAATNLNALVVNTDTQEKDYLSVRAYLGLSQLNLLQEDYEKSIESGLQALELATSQGFTQQILEARELLAQAYEKSGNYQLALEQFRKRTQLRDSVYTLNEAQALAGLSDDIRFRMVSKTVNEQEEVISDLRSSASRSEITAILTSAFLTIISLLAVSLYRNNQIKLKTNDLLQTKNRELQAARDAAIKAMEAKTNFLSTVSHELRTPLYAVTGLTHLLLEENPTESQKEHLKSLKFSGDYLLNFINDILQINKIDADKLEPLNVDFNLRNVLTEVMNSLQQSAKANKTKLILDYDENIPKQLLSDPIKLSQVFMNLVGNALKFTHDGEVTVIAKLQDQTEEDVKVYFEVRDTGIGISQEQQENIFDSFEQGSIQINREYGGTGLGLTIVKSLLGLFGSRIQLESEPGKGSTFFFEIIMKTTDSIGEEEVIEFGPKEYELEGLHLLVVEDNKINQVITKKMLKKKGVESDIASNGTEAIEMAQANSYDGILMDIHMPGISGVEATIEIRKFNKDIPIIALTAISLDDSLETFYAAGCNDVVTKPFKPEVFYQKIGENILEPKADNTASSAE